MGGKLRWSDEQLKCLLDTCIEEVNKIGRKGGSMHKESWVRLGEVLKEKFDMDTTQKHLKNAFDNLKAKYIGWVYLRNKTGNLYNPETNSFALANEEWEEFKKGHPKAGSLRTRSLPYPDLCATLFDGSVSGSIKWTSTQTTSAGTSSSSHRVQTLQIEDIPNDGLEEDDDDDADDDGTSNQTSDRASGTYGDRAPDASANRPGKRAKTSKSYVTLDELTLDMQKALQHLVKNKKGPTVEECYEKLKLIGLDQMDPLFLAAFCIFGESINMREAWMALPPTPELLKGFIKISGTALGIFK